LIAAHEDQPSFPTRRSSDLENVTVAAPGMRAPLVQNVSLRVMAGQGLGVIGPSGAGKSSLVRAMVGAWPVLKGQVRIDGATLDRSEEHTSELQSRENLVCRL